MTKCTACGKHTYRHLHTAIRVALKCSAQRGVTLRYYRCPVGSGWHLTKNVMTAKEAS